MSPLPTGGTELERRGFSRTCPHRVAYSHQTMLTIGSDAVSLEFSRRGWGRGGGGWNCRQMLPSHTRANPKRGLDARAPGRALPSVPVQMREGDDGQAARGLTQHRRQSWSKTFRRRRMSLMRVEGSTGHLPPITLACLHRLASLDEAWRSTRGNYQSGREPAGSRGNLGNHGSSSRIGLRSGVGGTSSSSNERRRRRVYAGENVVISILSSRGRFVPSRLGINAKSTTAASPALPDTDMRSGPAG